VLLEGSDPIVCGYLYQHADGIELRVEKGVRDGRVFTALEVLGAGVAAAVLTTGSFDSRRDLAPVTASTGRVRLEGDLELLDAGGLLFAELAVAGGTLQLSGTTELSGSTAAKTTLELPAPLPRGVTALYLNCAGDLVRPD